MDPATAALRQFSALVSRVGELKEPEEVAADSELRPVVQGVAQNVVKLAAVVSSESFAPQFLKFQQAAGPSVRTDVDMEDNIEAATPVKAEEEAGPLVNLLVSCVGTLPMQTPAYTALTLGIEERAPRPEYAGFGSRSVTLASRVFGQQLDMALLTPQASMPACRCQHLLRYFALLSKTGMLLPYEDEDQAGEAKLQGLTVAGLLQTLTMAALRVVDQNKAVAYLLAQWVLSTIPFLIDVIPSEFLKGQLFERIESGIMEGYASHFAPGIGRSAVLLKSEQLEEVEGEDQDEEDEDDDDEDEDAGGQRCDTLQDLSSTVSQILQSGELKTRFTLLRDAPWKGLKAGDDQSELITFSSESLRLSIPGSSCIARILNDENVGYGLYSLDGIVFGRLPIFGSASEGDDEDEEEEEEEDESSQKSPQLQAYENTFNVQDRYFIAEAIRSCLLCHESSVSDTGVERGSSKDAAEQVWSISQLLWSPDPSQDPSTGFEYAVIESLLSLVLQSSPHGVLSHVYVSRVLLELTRLQPTVIPQVLVAAASNLFQFYMPSMVPMARENFSRWLAFHLINTDYQWPKAYWEHWGTHVVPDKRNCRGDFILRALAVMRENASDVSLLITQCLPPRSALSKHLLPKDAEEFSDDGVLASIETDIQERVWDRSEDPELLKSYVLSDEVAESVAGGMVEDSSEDKVWWRTRIMIRALVQPARKHTSAMRAVIERSSSQSEEAMATDSNLGNVDVLSSISESLIRYKFVLLACLTEDNKAHSENMDLQGEANTDEDDLLTTGEAYLLRMAASALGFSQPLLEGCMDCLLEQEVVSSQSVIRWVLGPTIVARWWDLCSSAVRLGMAKVLAAIEKSDGGDIGMVIDHGGDENNSLLRKRCNGLIQFAVPLIKECVSRAGTCLQNLPQSPDPKKLRPDEVDLIEGTKYFIVSTQRAVLESLQVSETELGEVRGLMMASDMSAKAVVAGMHDAASHSVAIEALAAVLRGLQD